MSVQNECVISKKYPIYGKRLTSVNTVWRKKVNQAEPGEDFIDCNDFTTTEELIEYLDSLEYDRKTLEKMLVAPMLLEEPKTGILEKLIRILLIGQIERK